MARRIMIVTGEVSGDLHGANLVRALKRLQPELEFCGMGGQDLAGEGVELLYDSDKVSVVGLVEVLAHLPDILAAQKVLRKALATWRPDLLVIIDLPDFNLLLAGKAKKLGIPVYYYITPQVWAWREGRVKTIASRVDKLGVILPFEEDFFRQRGLSADYVGHPLLDSVKLEMAPGEFRHLHGIGDDQLCVGILPGSRKKEVSRLLPIFLAAAEELQSQCDQQLVFLLPRAPSIDLEFLQQAGLQQFQDKLDLRVVAESRYDLMANCRAVVTASGTVTLELAILNIPMVVTYRLSRLTYLAAKLLVRLDHFSLVNLIARREVVPELLQDEVTAEQICNQLSSILLATTERKEQLAGLHQVRTRLGQEGASARAAASIIELLEAGK